MMLCNTLSVVRPSTVVANLVRNRQNWCRESGSVSSRRVTISNVSGDKAVNLFNFGWVIGRCLQCQILSPPPPLQWYSHPLPNSRLRCPNPESPPPLNDTLAPSPIVVHGSRPLLHSLQIINTRRSISNTVREGASEKFSSRQPYHRLVSLTF